MLNYNEIKERKYILVDDEPYEVISAHVSRKQANKPVNKTKLKSRGAQGLSKNVNVNVRAATKTQLGASAELKSSARYPTCERR